MIRTIRLVGALALALLTSLLVPVAAHAVGYQYWGFYQLTDGQWGTAALGPDAVVPEDGAVDGYRFAISAGDTPRLPRAVLTFEDICADTPVQDDMKRVGLVLDPGRLADAPPDITPPEPSALCVVAETGASSQEVLAQGFGELRVENGLVCAIAGYPDGGCAEEIAEPSPEALAADEPIDIPVAAGVGGGGDSADPSQEAPPTTDEATDGATNEATDEATGSASDDATSEATAQETTSPETTPAAPSDDATSPDAATDEDSGAGVPPWAWAVGVLVLLGILGWAASAARNRRLAEAQGPDEQGLDEHQPRPPREF